MDAELLKTLINRLDRETFEKLVGGFLHEEYGHDLADVSLGEGIWRRVLNRRPAYESQRFGAAGFYLTQHFPIEVFNRYEAANLSQPDLLEKLNWIATVGMEFDSYPTTDLYFLNNFANLPSPEFHDVLIEKYSNIVADISGLQRFFVSVGTCDTFVTQKPSETSKSFQKLLDAPSAISIRLIPGAVEVQPLFSEKYLDAGVTRGTQSLCGPVFVSVGKARDLFQEFTRLLSQNPKEAALESFLARHFQEVFGLQYDRIETQIWLRFPELDIVNRSRRLDIFLRNQVEGDWELFEVKRLVPLTRTYRDIPILSHEISGALSQLKNYSNILKQDRVKDALKREGIEYSEPELRLVVGRSPDIPVGQWRRIVADNSGGVKIITFDNLLKQMRLRLEDRERMLQQR